MSENNTSTQANNEVDLLQILNTVWNAVAKAIVVIFVFFVRKLHWFAITAAIALLISLGIHKRTVPTYSCTLPVQMNTLSNNYAVDFINQMPHKDDTVLFKKTMVAMMHIPDTVKVLNIKKISAHWGFDTNNDGLVDVIDINDNLIKNSISDTAKQNRIKDKFFVYVEVYNKNIISHIEKGLSHIFDNNAYVQQHNSLRLQQLQARIDKMTEQLNRLDSLEYQDYFHNKYDVNNRGKNNSAFPVMILNEKQRELFHSQIIGTHNQRLDLEAQLALYSAPLTVLSTSNIKLQEVTTFANTAEPILLVAFLLTFLVALVWVNRGSLKKAIFNNGYMEQRIKIKKRKH
ncbi:hypothetical protein FACS189452_09070 [Bacteroidia bacterium]|nr:hypothetical protein FACS189452_09070 [Bacteroidia bacterium]GHT81280.1 hypothetical protein FACS189467_5050 [Bacteroidia bacterium]